MNETIIAIAVSARENELPSSPGASRAKTVRIVTFDGLLTAGATADELEALKRLWDDYVSALPA